MIEEYVLGLVDWIQEQPLTVIYLLFLVIAYLENVIPPIPGDLLVVFGGYIAADQIVSFSGILAATTIGSVLGFMNLYYLGFYLGDSLREKRSRFRFLKYFDGEYMDKVELWMHRWGQGVIVANRYMAGTRSIISIMAGVTKTRVRSTVISATISAFSWNFILIGLGWVIGENWPLIRYYLNVYGTTILVIILLFVAYKIFMHYHRKKKTELPPVDPGKMDENKS